MIRKNINNSIKLIVVISLILGNAVCASASKPTATTIKKTFLDSLNFNYENSIWGKNPDVPLEPLGKTTQSTLKDLSYYGVFEDAPLLSTDRTIFVDSTYKIQLHTTKREVLEEKDETHSHVGLGMTFGPTWMTYNSEFGEGKMTMSPGVNILYDYYINKNWGFMVGVDFSFTSGTFIAKKYNDEYSYVDYEGDLLNFKYKVGEIEEINKLVLLDVPITISYTTGNLFGHAGLKIGVPIKLKYDQTLKDCDFQCEMPAYNTTLNHGVALGLNDNTSTFNGEFSSSPIMMMFTADVGYRFKINEKFSIAAGLFFDKALYRIKFKAESDENNIQYAKNKNVYDFLKTSKPKDESEMPAYLIHSSVLSGQKMSTKERIAESLGYTNFGLKISVTFDRYGKDYNSKSGESIDHTTETTLSSGNE